MNNFKKIVILSIFSISLLKAENPVVNKIEEKVETVSKTETKPKVETTSKTEKKSEEKIEIVNLSKKSEFELKLENIDNLNEISKFNLKKENLKESINSKIEELKKDETKNKVAIDKLKVELENIEKKTTIYSKYTALNVAEVIALKNIKTFDEAKLKTATEKLKKLEAEKKALKEDATVEIKTNIENNLKTVKDEIKLLTDEKAAVENSNKKTYEVLKEARVNNKVGITEIIRNNFSEIKDYAKNNKLKFGGKLLLAGFTVYGIYKAVVSLFEKTEEEIDFENNSNYEI